MFKVLRQGRWWRGLSAVGGNNRPCRRPVPKGTTGVHFAFGSDQKSRGELHITAVGTQRLKDLGAHLGSPSGVLLPRPSGQGAGLCVPLRAPGAPLLQDVGSLSLLEEDHPSAAFSSRCRICQQQGWWVLEEATRGRPPPALGANGSLELPWSSL